MGTRDNPGAFDALVRARPDEPRFVLLARDPFAGPLIRIWAALRQEAGEHPAVIEDALAIAVACEQYAIAIGKGAQVKQAAESAGVRAA